MDTEREKLLDRIEYAKNVITLTKSTKCRNDHKKALKRYEKELRKYDREHI